MNTCSEFNSMISAYLDKELDYDNRNRFERHIESCESCRHDTEEQKNIMALCSSIQDEELPCDFNDNLHSKLMDAAGNKPKNNSARKPVFLFNYKYIKIASSIAALFLLVLLFKDTIFIGKTSTNYIADLSQSVQHNHENEPGISQPTKSKDPEIAGTKSPAKDNNASALEIEQGSSDSTNNTSTAATSKKPSDTVASDSSKNSNHNPGANKVTTMTPKENKLILTDTSISLNSTDTSAEAGKIKTLALSHGAEFSDSNTSGSSGDTNIKTSLVSKNITLTFKLPLSQYDSFANNLKQTYISSDITVGDLNKRDAEESINALKSQIADLDNSILEEESVQDSDKSDVLNSLKNAKDSKQKDLDSLLKDTEYVSVTIVISVK